MVIMAQEHRLSSPEILCIVVEVFSWDFISYRTNQSDYHILLGQQVDGFQQNGGNLCGGFQMPSNDILSIWVRESCGLLRIHFKFQIVTGCYVRHRGGQQKDFKGPEIAWDNLVLFCNFGSQSLAAGPCRIFNKSTASLSLPPPPPSLPSHSPLPLPSPFPSPLIFLF